MAETQPEQCSDRECTRPARMAVRTTKAPSTGDIHTTLYYDAADAPKRALRYCRGHGAALAAALVNTLSDADEVAA